MTINQLFDIYKGLANQHTQIADVYIGTPQQAMAATVDYPLLCMYITNVKHEKLVSEHTLHLYFLDKLLPDESNLNDVINAQSAIANDYYLMLTQQAWVKEYGNIVSYQSEVVADMLADKVAGNHTTVVHRGRNLLCLVDLPLSGNEPCQSEHYRGYYNSYDDLISYVPTANDGDYALVVNGELKLYVWDKEAEQWTEISGGGGSDVRTVYMRGNGNTIPVNTSGRLYIGYSASIVYWRVYSSSGGVTVDFNVAKNGSDIVGSGNKPYLNNEQERQETISGWLNNAVTNGDYLDVTVNSNSNATDVYVVFGVLITE